MFYLTQMVFQVEGAKTEKALFVLTPSESLYLAQSGPLMMIIAFRQQEGNLSDILIQDC